MNGSTLELETPEPRLVAAARFALAGLFLLATVNRFVSIFPAPPPGKASDFFAAVAASGYLLPLLAAVQLVGALLLLRRRWVPLALVLLAPVVVNVAAFHLFLAPAGLAVVMVLLVTAGTLAWSHRHRLRALLAPRAEGGAAPLVLRLLLGLAFCASGGYALVAGPPPASTESAAAFLRGLDASGYFLPLLAGTQVVAGLLLLAGRFVPLALAMLAPIAVSIVGYRLALGSARGLPVAIALVAVMLAVAYAHRQAIAVLWRRAGRAV